MKIALAQLKSAKGDINENINRHLKLIEKSIENEVNAIFFPELSLTGYEPILAKSLAIHSSDKKLNIFQEVSNSNNITICVGIPTLSKHSILISMIIFQAQKPRQTYSKQILHSDEFPYFIEGKKQVIISNDSINIAPAICYESLQVLHIDYAIKQGANIYVSSVAKSQVGIEKAYSHYSEMSKKYSIPILMSNSIGFCDNFISAGQSAIWSKTGELLTKLDNKIESVIVYDVDKEEVFEL